MRMVQDVYKERKEKNGKVGIQIVTRLDGTLSFILHRFRAGET